MSIHLDNTALGQLVIKGPASGVVNLVIPDMTGLANKLLALNSSGEFVFNDIPTAYVLPVATDTVLGGVKQGTGITIAADGTISATGTAGVTLVNGKTGEVTLTADDITGISTVGKTGAYSDLTGAPTLAAVATSGAYSDLTGTPNLATVATSGSYNDLTDKPADYTLPVATDTVLGGVKQGSNVTIAADGTISVAAIPTNVSAFTNDSGYQTASDVNSAIQAVVGAAPEALNTLQEIAAQLQADESAASALTTTVAAKADTTYVDSQLALKANAADLATVATTGQYSDLVGAPTLATVATSGSYNDLTDKPADYSLPVATDAVLGGVKDGAGVAIAADGTLSADVLSVAGKTGAVTLVAADVGGLATVATSGSYNDLADKPTIPDAYTLPVATDTVLGGVKQGTGITIGGDGTISNNGQMVFGNGGVTPVLATLDTTSDTPGILASFAMVDNSSMMFTADVVVRNADGTKAAGYVLQGVVKRGTGAGSTAFTGSVMKSIIAEDITALDANAVINSGSGSVDFTVIGSATETLHWFCNVRATYIK